MIVNLIAKIALSGLLFAAYAATAPPALGQALGRNQRGTPFLLPINNPLQKMPIENPDATSGAEDQGIAVVSARKLTGYVYMAIQKDTPVSQVLIEEYDASWDRVLGSTHTDYFGHFSLKPARGRKVHFLRLTAKGFRSAEYAVTLSPDAAPELKLKLRLSPSSIEVPRQKAPSLSLASFMVARAGES